MKLKYIPLISIFLSLYVFLNYYIGKTILKSLNNFLHLKQIWFWFVFGIIALSYVISMLIGKFLPENLNNIFNLLGSYWMAFFMYALILFPIMGLINLIITRFNINNTTINIINLIQILLISALFIIFGVLGSFNAKDSYVNYLTIPIEKYILNTDLNIVMVSDIHLGNIIGNKRLSKMVEEINNLNPDVVLIAGDIVDTDITPFLNNNMAKEFSKIKSTYGTYATLGNHDLMTNSDKIIESELELNKVNVLRDEAILINESFYIIGRDDISINRIGRKRESLDNITNDLDKSKLKIVIDHTPTSIDESLNSKIDIHFSGHTHAGQITPGNLVTKKLFEIDHGHLQKDNLNVIVSSGYGTWGPPIRIGSKSEIINVILTAK